MIGDNMQRVAQILVNIPTRSITKAFSYTLPSAMEDIGVGWRVLVPFGNRKVEGFVINVSNSDETGLKQVIEVLDETPWFNENMLITAKWLSEYYLCSLAEAMRLFIPGKSGIKNSVKYTIATQIEIEQAKKNLAAQPAEYLKLFMYLVQCGPLSVAQMKRKFGECCEKIVRFLMQRKLIIREYSTQKKLKAKYTPVIRLAVERKQALAYAAGLAGKPAQHRLLSVLLDTGELKVEDLKALKISRDTIKRLVAAGVLEVNQKRILRDSYADISEKAINLRLNSQQEHVLQAIVPYISKRKYHSFLLHGITGSGKTQIYIEAVAEARRNNRQAIVLVPEIALTSQIVARFKARFGNDVVVMHSKLSVNERSDAMQRLRSGQAGIAIGARSAIFAPIDDLGIVVIDEEHEFTYKQEEAPRYHTRQVALTRADFAGAVVVLGSATPAIDTYYQALQGKHTLLEMSERINGATLPQVEIVDMRKELKCGRRSVISLPLQYLLAETIQRGEQAVILLNRRGYSTFVLCRECGHIMRCRHCSISMVYHNNGRLRCHYCQASELAPDICPVCGSRYIRYFGTGTQRLEEELTKMFPGIRIARMDQDTTGGKLDHDRILNAFAGGNYDILLGTQMVAKGHDIKNVTAVGIITADSALNLPDFRAAEKTFALLTQAAGRAGRGQTSGKVIIQTYNPDHYAVKAGANHDYENFYHSEINYRKELFYPPFSHIIKVTILANNESDVRRKAENIASELKAALNGQSTTQIVGPFVAPLAKINNVFRMTILIKTIEDYEVKSRIAILNLHIRPDIIIDVDPLNIM